MLSVERQREIIALHQANGFGSERIANQMGLCITSVRLVIRRGWVTEPKGLVRKPPAPKGEYGIVYPDRRRKPIHCRSHGLVYPPCLACQLENHAAVKKV